MHWASIGRFRTPFEFESTKSLAVSMTGVCRLCASLKTLEQLKTLDDPNLALQKKLVRCCEFRLPTTNDEYMPQNVCNDCVVCLNKSWAFAEKVADAQEILKRAFLTDYIQKNCSPPNDTTADIDSLAAVAPKNDGSGSETNVNHSDEILGRAKGLHDLSFKSRSVIISLHIKGYSNEQISAKLNVSPSIVADWLFTYQTHTTDSNREQDKSSHRDELQPVASLAASDVVSTDVTQTPIIEFTNFVSKADYRTYMQTRNVFLSRNFRKKNQTPDRTK